MKELRCPHCQKVFTIDESAYSEIAEQIKTKEFDNEVETRVHSLLKEAEANKKLEILKAHNESNDEIQKLKDVITAKDADIAKVKSQLEVVTLKQEAATKEAVAARDAEVNQLKAELELEKKKGELNLKSAKEDADLRLKDVQAQLEYYKDLKVRLSTKLLGETLEQHCQNAFNQIRTAAFPKAEFHKDNDVVDGTKGDYVFRDFTDEGAELVSVLFEMKNENDASDEKNKKKIDSFFKKAHEDRVKKECEYCVIVTTLEADSDLYNQGIVDVSYEYEKMYVIRPQFFIPFITLIRNAALRNEQTKNELVAMRLQNIDIVNFEDKLNEFKADFTMNVDRASKQHDTAIEEIDKTIAHLQKVRQSLVGSSNNLNIANRKVQDITIRKLTYQNPTMKQLLEENKTKE